MGLGILGGGLSAARWLEQQGAILTITDLKTAKQLKSSLKFLKNKKIKYTLGRHLKSDFKDQDLIVQNPGVPRNSVYLDIARQHKIPIVNEAVLFFQNYKYPKIGVTGTRGKSTTATLIHHILKTKIKNNILAGNIATNPMLGTLSKLGPNSWPVLELSSWHLERLADFRLSPKIAVVTSIYPDHLNRYKNMAEYIQAKLAIAKNQKSGDYVVLNYDDQVVRSFAKKTKASVYYFSLNHKICGAYLKNNFIYFQNQRVMPIDKIKLLGQHNLQNILASITVAKILKINNSNIERAVNNFKGVDYRLQYLGKINQIKVYNDAASTSPDACRVALESLSGKVVLIAGGVDKGLLYRDLAKTIKNKVDFLILLSGTASQKINQELKRLNFPPNKIAKNISSLKKAWQLALAQKPDIILFSPAAASFNMFINEFDRAGQFASIFYDDQKKKKT